MATVTCSATTSVPPEGVVQALTDFGPQRPQRWPNLDPRLYTVHHVGPTSAEVTEGSSFAGGVWERARYDWSQPGVVHIDVLDSNTFQPGGSWTYEIQARADGTLVNLRVVRCGRTLKGRLLEALLRVTGQQVFCGDLRKTLLVLEHQHA